MPATLSTIAFGYLVRSVSVSNWPIATATSRIPNRAHSTESVRIMFSTAARAAPVWTIPGNPMCGETVMLTTLPALLRDERLGRGGVGHLPGALDVQLDHGPEALRA